MNLHLWNSQDALILPRSDPSRLTLMGGIFRGPFGFLHSKTPAHWRGLSFLLLVQTHAGLNIFSMRRAACAGGHPSMAL